MKIGVGVPCHTKDLPYLPLVEHGISALDPAPFSVLLDVNNGEDGIRQVRTRIFNELFSRGCDVVLQCSADFYLMKTILSHIEPNCVTTFAFLKKSPSAPIDIIKFLLSPKMWTGCYSLPRKIWGYINIHEGFTGYDSSIAHFCQTHKIKIKRVRKPQYWLLNPSKDREYLRRLPTSKKITRMISRWDHR